MSMRLLLQMSLLLMIGQVVTGALSLGLSAAGLPWLGLPLLLMFLWLVHRTGRVLREDLEKANRRKERVMPERIALFVGLLWQLPGLLALLPSIRDWAAPLWNGTLLTIPGTVGIWLPSVAESLALAIGWAAWLGLSVYFMWVVLRTEKVKRVTAVKPVTKVSETWAAARTLEEVARRRGNVAAATMEKEGNQ